MLQLKASELLESVYDLPASPKVVAQLQVPVLELQGELEECEPCDKKLHDPGDLQPPPGAEQVQEEVKSRQQLLSQNDQLRQPSKRS